MAPVNPPSRGPIVRSNHFTRRAQTCLVAAVIAAGLVAGAFAQQPDNMPPAKVNPETRASERATTTAHKEQPLPDIPALMRQVEANQRNAEAVEKTYLYHSVETRREQQSAGHEKITIVESDHFWLDGVPVRRIVKKEGKDLSPDELAKEDRRIEKQAREAREHRDKIEAAGKESDPQGNEEITVSRLLELGSFTNPRRVSWNGRDTIAVDYTGDAHAKTRNRAEEVIRDMAGTAWVDEQDKVLVRAQGRFVRPFKIGAGLLVNIRQDTSFTFEQTRVNDEVWLPAKIEAQGAARAMLLFGFTGKIEIADSDYRKFRTSTRILPQIPADPAPDSQADKNRR